MTNKEILITGGTGTLGNALVKLLLKMDIKGIRIFSRDELKQHEMRNRLNNPDKVAWMIGDVRDPKRLTRAMEGVDIVIHAAAMKQVGSCEDHPLEAIQTNIHGAENVLTAALANKVEKVMNVSTDKAVYPINLYGATKMAAEKLFINGNVYGGGRTKFSVCRYGNVFGSRGSVVPIFMKARETGEVGLTHPYISRFWITVDRVAKFLIDRIEDMQGKEIFIPVMPSMYISDLAKAILGYDDIVFKKLGVPKSEKIHEMLFTDEESMLAVKVNKMFYIIYDSIPSWMSTDNCPMGVKSFNSETCPIKLTKKDVQQMLKELEEGK